jgi:hypothetical protein
MNPDDISGLYYITHIANIESICQKGILSHALAKQLPHTSIAKSEVVELRKKKSVPQGRPLLEYVNLYFNPRNPMMYKVTDGGARIDDICLLKVGPNILMSAGVVITDGNAASSYTRFYPSPAGLASLKRDEIFITSWNDEDPVRRFRLKSTTCSEVLVPDCIEPRFILEAILPGTEMVKTVYGKTGAMELTTDKTLFFG